MSETIPQEKTTEPATETVAAEKIEAEKTEKETPQTQTFDRPSITDPKTLHLFYDPPGTLRLTIGDGDGAFSYPTVRAYQAAPLSTPGRYLSIHDGKGEELVMVPEASAFTPSSREAVEEEIRRRYLTAKVQAITNIKTEFGITYWHVVTDRGERDFVVQSLSESCLWLSDTHILLVDVDGNRFEIADRNALDPTSAEWLSTVL